MLNDLVPDISGTVGRCRSLPSGLISSCLKIDRRGPVRKCDRHTKNDCCEEQLPSPGPM